MRFGQHPHVCLLAICAEAHDLVAPLGNRQPATGNRQHQIPGAQLQCHDGAASLRDFRGSHDWRITGSGDSGQRAFLYDFKPAP
jgi:hypothetical protein